MAALVKQQGAKLVELPSGDFLDPLSIRGIQARRTHEDKPRIINGIQYLGFVKIETATNTYYVQCRTYEEAVAIREELAALTNERHSSMVPKRYKQGPAYTEEDEGA